MKETTYAIVGGGVAAASAAEALRGEAFDGRIIIIGEEAEAPYERPPLSKAFLRGEIEPAAVALRTSEFYKSNAIELFLGRRVIGIDLPVHSVSCSDGQDIPYSKLLIATGAKPRQLDVAGSDLSGVHYLRWLNDALHLRTSLSRRPKVLVVGTGFIGCEVAASARQIGCEVTLVGPSLPMEHVLGKEVAALYWRFHHDHGVSLKSGVSVTAFCGEKVLEAARLSDGTEAIATSLSPASASFPTLTGFRRDQGERWHRNRQILPDDRYRYLCGRRRRLLVASSLEPASSARAFR